jgi:(p)ppGpp synthase/HD superfamily hydrolase
MVGVMLPFRVRRTADLVKRLTDRKDWRGRGYYQHSLEVMNLLPRGSTELERQAALLHSVLDTGAATPEDLSAYGIAPEVVEVVKLVSNGPGVQGRAACLQKCRDIVASGNRSAMKVKLAEMLASAGYPVNDCRETIEIVTAGLCE